MGCTQSKIENEEAVSRCKERKHFMKQAVSFRNAFAAAHVAYAMGLKNTGAALSDYAHGESQNQQGVAVSQPPLEPVIRPPPPPVYPTTPIQRAASMPEMKLPKSREPNGVGPTILEENDDDDEDDEMEANEKLITRKKSSGRNKAGDQKSVMGEDQAPPSPLTKSSWAVQEPPSPPLQNETYDYFFGQVENIPRPTLEEVKLEEIERKVFEERRKREEEVEEKAKLAAVEQEKAMAAAAAAEEEEMVVASVPMSGGGSVGRNSKRGKAVATGGEKMIVKGSINLVKIFEDLDDHFLKASESAHDVSKMLEATRLHYHSNFADNRGHIDHSARVMRVITWNRSFKGLDLDDVKDDFDSEEHETHATVLDKLLAWEKKLYDEVKAGELMKFEYQRKIASLNKQKKRGTNAEALEKIKAAVSHLHTRYIVDMQSMDSTVLEINRLRDEQLYPKLVQLVDGMATMWATMQTHHEQQHKIVYALRFLDLSQSPKETTEHHHERTFQLWSVVQDWHTQFCRLMDNQKDYIKALNSWLKLNLIPIESSLREKVSSPPRVTTPPIQRLLIAWLDYLERLPDEGARSAINNFAAIINTIMHHQQDEIKLKEKCEETRKELFRKNRQFEDWYHKYTQRRTPDELEPERTEDSIHKDAVQERKFVVDMVKKRLEEEEEAHQRTCIQVREKSLTSLRTHLPELFRAMSDISLACSRMYGDLSKITMSQQQNPSESSSRE